MLKYILIFQFLEAFIAFAREPYTVYRANKPLILEDYGKTEVDFETIPIHRQHSRRVDLVKFNPNLLRIPIIDMKAFIDDYPELNICKEDEIKDYMKNFLGYLAKSQLKGDGLTNTKIPARELRFGDRFPIAFRPPAYGRNFVIEMHPVKYNLLYRKNNYKTIELKGGGAVDPQPMENIDNFIIRWFRSVEYTSGHSNGLMDLADAFYEYNWEKVVAVILRYGYENGFIPQPIFTVKNYGIMSLPFSVALFNKNKRPAAILFRKTHLRGEYKDRKLLSYSGENGQPFYSDPEVLVYTRKLTRLFLHFGVWTSIPFSEKISRFVSNLQLSTAGEVLDFGHYTVREKYTSIKDKIYLTDDDSEIEKSLPDTNEHVLNPNSPSKSRMPNPKVWATNDWPFSASNTPLFKFLLSWAKAYQANEISDWDTLNIHCKLLLPFIIKISYGRKDFTSTYYCPKNYKKLAIAAMEKINKKYGGPKLYNID